MLVYKGVFVLSLISESQSFDVKCLKRPSLYLLDSLLKEVCVLEIFHFGFIVFFFMIFVLLEIMIKTSLNMKCVF